MAELHIKRITAALHKLFDAELDCSDTEKRPTDQQETAFLSRSLAAFCLTFLGGASAADAARAVTDGFDDYGVDAVFFDEQNTKLFVAQSKWIANGNGSPSVGETKKFLGGVCELVNLRLDRFNQKMQEHEQSLESALLNPEVRIVLVMAHTGTHPLSDHVNKEFESFLDRENDPVVLLSLEHVDQARIYNAVAGHAERKPISFEIVLEQWGHVKAPFPAYYGQVDARSVAEWWSNYGRDLFVRNIRDFKGSTDINLAIESTLRSSPEHFWYFNNGITVLCSKVAKKPLGASNRDSAVFECDGVSIVNGAQTVGTIGKVAEHGISVDNARVLVRLLSLADCPAGFDKLITRAANTQNRIERRDFAALDPNQRRLAREFRMDGRKYAYKSGDQDPPHAEGCSIVQATIALACATPDVDLAVQAKREIGRLWEDIEAPPYTTLFNDNTQSIKVWQAVQIMRAVDQRLMYSGLRRTPRANLIAVHGNRLILHLVFNAPKVLAFRRQSTDAEDLVDLINPVTDSVFEQLALFLDQNYENAYPASFFKNQKRCRAAVQAFAPASEASTSVTPPETRVETESQPGLFDDT